MNEPVTQPKRTRRKFDNAFKQRAVELWLSSGRSGKGVLASALASGGTSTGAAASGRVADSTTFQATTASPPTIAVSTTTIHVSGVRISLRMTPR